MKTNKNEKLVLILVWSSPTRHSYITAPDSRILLPAIRSDPVHHFLLHLWQSVASIRYECRPICKICPINIADYYILGISRSRYRFFFPCRYSPPIVTLDQTPIIAKPAVIQDSSFSKVCADLLDVFLRN